MMSPAKVTAALQLFKYFLCFVAGVGINIPGVEYVALVLQLAGMFP